MAASPPRAVVVRRRTDYELLLSRHATRGQAAFFLQSRGQDIDAVESDHQRVQAALNEVSGHIPQSWRRAEVNRDDLDRFLFEPRDIVFAVGQDGLVANLAKYLSGQLVVGVNTLPERFDGVLARFAPKDMHELMGQFADNRTPEVESRTMVRAELDDAQSLLALNEIFIGHRTHQSARYRIRFEEQQERHSSSGVIVASGTGSTGWAKSINLSRGEAIELPSPTDRKLAFFVREPFPSVSTGTAVASGLCSAGRQLEFVSEMNTGGVVFGDGIEDDFISFDWGCTLTVGIADRTLNLVVP